MQDTNLLKFSPGKANAKLKQLGGVLYTFSLSSGHACPFAQDCLSKAVEANGTVHIEDGPKTQFRCFSASQEVVFPNLRKQRQYNFNLLREAKTTAKMTDLIKKSLPKKATVIRIHVGGDMFNQNYFNAWRDVAKDNPTVTFYAYTKSLPYWVNQLGKIPTNFKLNASKGGRHDNLIEKHNLKYAEVVYTEQEAVDKGLDIDHDDSHAFLKDESFALIIHGTQPKGSKASEAVKNLKGVGSYGKTNNN